MSSLREAVAFAILTMCSGCAVTFGGQGVAGPMDLDGMSGRRVEVTSVEVTPPNVARDVTTSGEVRLLTGDTVYLTDSQALPRAKIVAVHEPQPTLLHDVAMATLAGFAMHLAINGLHTGLPLDFGERRARPR